MSAYCLARGAWRADVGIGPYERAALIYAY